ncbi:hypothetical protein [Bradyrhizobium sp. STM 3562]|uniref:hypothetical protein n=1 Tax=Bradyrhizobium sp. STM 3562 TaxID=578924 RepID=UPI00388FD1DA
MAKLTAPRIDPLEAHNHADTLIRVAGSLSLLNEIDDEFRQAGLDEAVASGNTPIIFDWLLTAFSFQGISDKATRSYRYSGLATRLYLASRLGVVIAIGDRAR